MKDHVQVAIKRVLRRYNVTDPGDPVRHVVDLYEEAGEEEEGP